MFLVRTTNGRHGTKLRRPLCCEAKASNMYLNVFFAHLLEFCSSNHSLGCH